MGASELYKSGSYQYWDLDDAIYWDSNNKRIMHAGNDAIAFYSSSAANATITEFARFDIDTKRLGIGTSSPASVLHVLGGSVTIPTLSSSHPFLISGPNNSGMSIISSTGNAGQVVFGDESDADVGRLRYDHSDNSMRFWTNADERMRITSNGNVGIGTTTPSEMLHISGATGRIRIEDENHGTSTPQLYIEGNKSNSSNAIATLIELKSNLDVRGRGIHYTHANSSSNTNPTYSEEYFSGVPYGGGGFQIGFDEIGGRPWYKVSSSLFIKENGMVGIGRGNTSPATQLHLSSSSTTGLTIQGAVGNTKNIFFSKEDNVHEAKIRESAGTLGFFTGGDMVDANARLFITSESGKVGIGTASPTEKLTVEGNISASGNLFASLSLDSSNLNTVVYNTTTDQFFFTGSYGGGSTFTAAGISGSWQGEGFISSSGEIASDISGAIDAATGSLSASLSANTFKTTGQRDGDSGITGSLTLQHETSPTLAIKNINTNYALRLQQDPTNAIISFVDNTNHNLVFTSANDTYHLFLDSGNGFTGIGTDTPTEKLQVEGNISSSGAINTLSHITASGDISASGLLSISSSQNSGQTYGVLVKDPNTGRVYHTGSYGTGDTVDLHFSASEGTGFSFANGATASFESGSAGITVTAGATNKITIGASTDNVTFNQITGSDLIITNTASISITLKLVYETASVIYSSGSTKFGNSMDDDHWFTGSMLITASEFIWDKPLGSALTVPLVYDVSTGKIYTGSEYVAGASGMTQFHS
jgi:hypothetical protein